MNSVELSGQEIREKIKRETDASKRDRYRALLWVQQKKPVKRIAELLGVSRRTISRWLKRYSSDGESGLSRKPGQGRRRTLTPVNVNLKMGNYGGRKVGRNSGEKLPLEWP